MARDKQIERAVFAGADTQGRESDHAMTLGDLLVSKLAVGDNDVARGALRTLSAALLVMKDAMRAEDGPDESALDSLLWGLHEFTTLAIEVDERFKDAQEANTPAQKADA